MPPATGAFDLEKAYANAISDEHYHREMFQNRLSYHTNVVLVALGGVVAGLLEAQRAWSFRLLGFATVLIGILAVATPEMLVRIYRHFIEHLDVRERLEVALGLRDPAALGDAAALGGRMGPRPIPSPPSVPPLSVGILFTRSWIRAGREYGYFTWMSLLFRVVGATAIVSGVALLLLGGYLANSPAEPEGPVSNQYVEELLGTVGPFEPTATCVSTAALESQVIALAARARQPRVRRLLFVGIADRVPVSAAAQSFGNNTGIALSRARCVAGWITERLAWNDETRALDIRVKDAAAATTQARSRGAASDRVVEVYAYCVDDVTTRQ